MCEGGRKRGVWIDLPNTVVKQRNHFGQPTSAFGNRNIDRHLPQGGDHLTVRDVGHHDHQRHHHVAATWLSYFGLIAWH